MIYVGRTNHTIDSKNRIVLPSKFVEVEHQTFYIAPKLNQECLGVYTEEQFQRISDKVYASPDSEVHEIALKIFSDADYVTLDDNNRAVLNKDFISMYHFEKDIVIAGAGNHFQIWKKETWEKQKEISQHVSIDKEQLIRLGL